MTQYSVKMSDGTRYDFEENGMKRLFWKDDGWIVIEHDNKQVSLNTRHIVSITIMGDGDDS